ncbi:PH (Pleckstrin Homology) domain-containing protein [Sediminihabitans luteus]|uniref:PH (Pleckstrin Homology) domain-containing protein n=1 Tax=Sediminihabitans luteus TaxID=1138585 RepID=A0A2M9CQ47_9CELL|nr:PH domain-containing protein [Sediminihabitans luteus]PJJ73968.1 PH (Pleckstrin Homology) domain-containing protein [Sediminihabitans luteus]GII98119.1 hypothetical protein Slu03_04970 [Sediminihabitans luteus]
MIDFDSTAFVRLSEWKLDSAEKALQDVLIDGEVIELAFNSQRDSVTFTDKRIVALNVQGMTGTKKAYTSLPYAKVQAFAVETNGTTDLDAELVLWFSHLGRVAFQFSRGVDIHQISALIATHAL